MKFTVTMKDPDALQDTISAAVKALVEFPGLSEDEADLLRLSRSGVIAELCEQWFEYGEHLSVEIDTEAETATVKRVGEVGK